MGVKGYLRIDEEDGGLLKSRSYTFEKLKEVDDTLRGDEAILMNKLFGKGDTRKISSTYSSTMESMKSSLSSHYSSVILGKYAERNIGYSFVLVLMAIGVTVGTYVIKNSIGDTAVYVLPAVFISLIITAVVAVIVSFIDPSDSRKSLLFRVIQFTITFGVFIAIASYILTVDFSQVSVQIDSSPFMRGVLYEILALSIMYISIFIAIRYMGRYSTAGLDVKAQTDGLKMFLLATEEESIKILNRELDVETFNRYLPFALALGVDTQWSDKFESTLAKAMQDATNGGGVYHPHWYSGSRGVNGIAGGLSGAMASTLSSSATHPSSSSGGGGGSGGGGSGGGGGGGW